MKLKFTAKKEGLECTAKEAMIAHKRELQCLRLQNDLDQKETFP